MSTERERIVKQLRLLHNGKPWLGPSMTEILTGIDEPLARQHSIPGAHSVWELVLHITAWLRIARERLSATETRDASDAENWPTPAGSWQDALDGLDREVEALAAAILAFPEERLHEQAPAAEPQSFYGLLHGVLEHTAYHCGQITLLKKNPAPANA